MTLVRFFEKTGCINNTRQKALLREAGYELHVHDLLSYPWTPLELARFFVGRPIGQCFNRTAPRIKSGEIDPDCLSATLALELMVDDPLLIRRPLLETARGCGVGFDDLERLGIDLSTGSEDVETCPRTASGTGT
ncbi:hypothetical protein JCM17960_07270 [Magnetospira thiophila]